MWEFCELCVVASEETRNFKLIERMEQEREINEMKNFSVDFDFFASIFVTLSIKKSLLSQCVWQVLDFQISESSERVKTRVKFTINKIFFMFHISLHLGAIWKGFKESCKQQGEQQHNFMFQRNGNDNTQSQYWKSVMKNLIRFCFLHRKYVLIWKNCSEIMLSSICN